MVWVEITLEDVLANMPTDLRPIHEAWIQEHPDKASRLGVIVDNTIREFRDAIRSNKANLVDPREAFLPRSAVRHLENIVLFQLAMEIGIDLSTAANSARTSADVFLRQLPFGRWNTTSGDAAALPSPRFTIPERLGLPGRTLPALVGLLLLLLPPSASANWIRHRPDQVMVGNIVITTLEEFDTDELAEGGTNLYHTAGRAVEAVTVSGHFLDRRDTVDPVFVIQNPLHSGFTDFELKGSTDNFATLSFFFHSPNPDASVVTGQVRPADPQVFYTDSQRPDRRQWVVLPADQPDGIAQRLHHADSSVGAWLIVVRGYGHTRADWRAWQWSFVFMDGVGYPETDLAGRSVWRLTHPADYRDPPEE